MISDEQFEALKAEVAEVRSELPRIDKAVSNIDREHGECHASINRALEQFQKNYDTHTTVIEGLMGMVAKLTEIQNAHIGHLATLRVDLETLRKVVGARKGN